MDNEGGDSMRELIYVLLVALLIFVILAVAGTI